MVLMTPHPALCFVQLRHQEGTSAEAQKFLLLPPDGDHSERVRCVCISDVATLPEAPTALTPLLLSCLSFHHSLPTPPQLLNGVSAGRCVDETKSYPQDRVVWNGLQVPKAKSWFFGRSREIHHLVKLLNDASGQVGCN